MSHFPIEAVLFVFLAAMAVAIIRLRHLFAAAMLTGMFSLLSAGLFVLMDAVDVAFTEAAVGAGISTVLFVGALSLTTIGARRHRRFRKTPLLVVIATGAALVYGTLDMPAYGDPEAPIHQHVAPYFVTVTVEEVEIPNIVTVVLGSIRGYDTLGETTVVLVAGVAVMLLLGGRHHRDPEDL